MTISCAAFERNGDTNLHVPDVASDEGMQALEGTSY
jgi:hypothetical protein